MTFWLFPSKTRFTILDILMFEDVPSIHLNLSNNVGLVPGVFVIANFCFHLLSSGLLPDTFRKEFALSLFFIGK